MRSRAPERNESERTCIVTGAILSPAELIRFVVDPDGGVIADLGAKLPGRGAWVTGVRATVETAASRGLFSRVFRRAASIEPKTPSEFSACVGRGLRARALSALGLSRRAGVAFCGFDLVEAALREGRASVVFVASDAGADGRGKIARLAGDKPAIDAFSSAELSAALGKDGLVYAALRDGAEAQRALETTRRALRFDADPLDADPPVPTATIVPS